MVPLRQSQPFDFSAAPRLTRAGAKAIFERLQQGEFLNNECVVLIGLDAIRERLGPLWSARRELVWDAAERVFSRRLNADALWARVSDVDFIVCSGDDKGLCRSHALKALRELLEFFLGVQRYEDMRISSVVTITDEEIGCRPLDPRSIEEKPERSATPEKLSSLTPLWSALSFVTVTGEALELGFQTEQVCNLRNGVAIATRIAPTICYRETGVGLGEHWAASLSPSGLETVNSATVQFARSVYKTSPTGVMVTSSIYTLFSVRNRSDLIRHLERLDHDAAKPIIFELLDIDAGTPQGRILEIVSALAPHCRKVVARVPLQKPPLELLRGCRLAGLSVDCASLQEDSHEFIRGLASFAERAKAVAPLSFALGLTSGAASALARSAGMTHAGRCSSVH